jgi:hypothetical protein
MSQVSCQLSWHTPLHNARIGFTFVRSRRIPVPVRRACTTSVFARSTIPEPIGQKAASKGRIARQGETCAHRCEMLSNVSSPRLRFCQRIDHAYHCLWAVIREYIQSHDQDPHENVHERTFVLKRFPLRSFQLTVLECYFTVKADELSTKMAYWSTKPCTESSLTSQFELDFLHIFFRIFVPTLLKKQAYHRLYIR